MAVLLGGIIATILGVVLLVVWIEQFLLILQGAIPIILALGGALAIYIGIDDIKSSVQTPKESS